MGQYGSVRARSFGVEHWDKPDGVIVAVACSLELRCTGANGNPVVKDLCFPMFMNLLAAERLDCQYGCEASWLAPGTMRVFYLNRNSFQGTFKEHLRNIQGTFREHSGNIQGTLFIVILNCNRYFILLYARRLWQRSESVTQGRQTGCGSVTKVSHMGSRQAVAALPQCYKSVTRGRQASCSSVTKVVQK
jgi:hypothetical protein